MIPEFLLQKEKTKFEDEAVKYKLSFIDKTMKNAASFITASFSQYHSSKKNGLLQFVDPRVKVFIMICFTVTINLSHNILSQFILFSIIFSFSILSKVKLVSLYKKAVLLGFVFGFLVFVPACLNIFTEGHPFVTLLTFSKEHQWWIYTIPKEIYITREGILVVLKLTFKVMNSVSMVLLVTSTTTFEGIVKSMSYFKVPGIFLLTLTMSYKYIFILSRTVEETYCSLKMRWWDRGSVTEAEKLIAGRIGYLFQKSWKRYELTYQSMIARGFEGSFNVYCFDKLKRIDYTFICINILFMVSIIVINLIYARYF